MLASRDSCVRYCEGAASLASPARRMSAIAPNAARAIAVALRPGAEQKEIGSAATMPAHPRPAVILPSTGQRPAPSVLYNGADEQTVKEVVEAIAPLARASGRAAT